MCCFLFCSSSAFFGLLSLFCSLFRVWSAVIVARSRQAEESPQTVPLREILEAGREGGSTIGSSGPSEARIVDASGS